MIERIGIMRKAAPVGKNILGEKRLAKSDDRKQISND
jgi:hypothetical protein